MRATLHIWWSLSVTAGLTYGRAAVKTVRVPSPVLSSSVITNTAATFWVVPVLFRRRCCDVSSPFFFSALCGVSIKILVGYWTLVVSESSSIFSLWNVDQGLAFLFIFQVLFKYAIRSSEVLMRRCVWIAFPASFSVVSACPWFLSTPTPSFGSMKDETTDDARWLTAVIWYSSDSGAVAIGQRCVCWSDGRQWNVVMNLMLMFCFIFSIRDRRHITSSSELQTTSFTNTGHGTDSHTQNFLPPNFRFSSEFGHLI